MTGGTVMVSRATHPSNVRRAVTFAMVGMLALASPAFAQTSSRAPEVRPDLQAGMQKIIKESVLPIGDHSRASRAPKGTPPAPSIGQHKARGALFAAMGTLGG